jgi:hypothetical protein
VLGTLLGKVSGARSGDGGRRTRATTSSSASVSGRTLDIDRAAPRMLQRTGTRQGTRGQFCAHAGVVCGCPCAAAIVGRKCWLSIDVLALRDEGWLVVMVVVVPRPKGGRVMYHTRPDGLGAQYLHNGFTLPICEH